MSIKQCANDDVSCLMFSIAYQLFPILFDRLHSSSYGRQASVIDGHPVTGQ